MSNSQPESEEGVVFSPIFCDENADLTIRSSDGVLFKVFSKNLSTFSTAFPSPEHIPPGRNEVIQLSESAAVLDLLFQFMRPQCQPDLHAISFKVGGALADAVQKYNVFPAGGVCNIYMSTAAPTFPIEVLKYSYKHSQPAVGDLAAPHTLGEDVQAIQHVFPSHGVLAWMLYREGWLTILHNIHNPYPDDGPHDTHPEDIGCDDWEHHRRSLLDRIGLRFESLVKLEDSFKEARSARTGCLDCRSMMRTWYFSLRKTINSLPKFSSFL